MFEEHAVLTPDLAQAAPLPSTRGAPGECRQATSSLHAIYARARLDTAASFARSVAHALNNVLFVASGNLRLLSSEGALGGESADLVREALESLAVGEALAAKLNALGAGQPFAPAIVDIAQVIRHCARRAQERDLPRLAVELSLPAEPVRVVADASYLQCALAALLQDLSCALGGEGLVRIACTRIPRSAQPVQAQTIPFVEVSFSDPVTRMTAKAASRAFELGYFAEPGGRIALTGLWFVREFARACGGGAYLDLRPPEGGTRVRIQLPSLE